MLVKESLLVGDRIIYQDDDLYRFTSDAVLLSRFASVKKGDVVADFCSGSGIVGIHLYLISSGKAKSVTLFEMQKPLHDLAVMTVKENGISEVVTPVNCKVQDIGSEYREKFSLITCNPPYRVVGTGEENEKEEIALCRTEKALTLKELCVAAAKALKFGGRFAISHRADRLSDVIYNMKINAIEPKRLQFVYSGSSKTPYLLLLEGVKGGKPDLKILENLRNGE